MGLPYPADRSWPGWPDPASPAAIAFARPMTDRPGLDFSFSGLKTQVLLAWRDSDQSPQRRRADIARGFRDAVVTDTLAIKCERALDAAGCAHLVVAGGVGADEPPPCSRLPGDVREPWRPRLFPRPLYRQRRDDRVHRRALRLPGRPTRGCRGRGGAALGHSDAAGGVTAVPRGIIGA